MSKPFGVLMTIAGAIVAAHCGGGATMPGSTDTLITITANGPRPTEVTVPRDSRVTFEQRCPPARGELRSRSNAS